MGWFSTWEKAGSDGATRAIVTAIRDRFRKWQGQYLATCARLDEAMTETAIRDRFQKWRGQRARLYEQSHQQQACYSLIAVQRATAVAKWLLGLSGAGMVLAFAFYIRSYLSILSIKNDCVSRRFVTDANSATVSVARWFLVSGMLALLAIAWPTAVGIVRNLRRWKKAQPPLQPGHEFDGWSEYQVTEHVTILQWVMVLFSSVFFFGLTLSVVFFAIGSKPEDVWHHFELQCLPQPSG
jgi:hypothetical protein